jgi:hypothetical protein
MKEISDDENDPWLIIIPFLGIQTVVVRQAFVFMMDLLNAKIDGFRTLSPLPCRQDFAFISGGVRLCIYRCCEKVSD